VSIGERARSKLVDWPPVSPPRAHRPFFRTCAHGRSQLRQLLLCLAFAAKSGKVPFACRRHSRSRKKNRPLRNPAPIPYVHSIDMVSTTAALHRSKSIFDEHRNTHLLAKKPKAVIVPRTMAPKLAPAAVSARQETFPLGLGKNVRETRRQIHLLNSAGVATASSTHYTAHDTKVRVRAPNPSTIFTSLDQTQGSFSTAALLDSSLRISLQSPSPWESAAAGTPSAGQRLSKTRCGQQLSAHHGAMRPRHPCR